MAVDPKQIRELVERAGRLVGMKEILRAGSFNPGQQTDLKRVLRELVRSGELVRDGKRFGAPGRTYDRSSGPMFDPPSRAKTKPEEREVRRGKAAADERAPSERSRSGRSDRERSESDRSEGDRAPTERSIRDRLSSARAAAPRAGAERPARAGGERAGRNRAGGDRAGGDRAGGDRAGRERSGRERAEYSRTPQKTARGAVRQPRRSEQPPPMDYDSSPASRERGPAPSSPGAQRLKGVIHHHPDGFAFFKQLGGAKGTEDVFIPPDEARKALDHDQVFIELVRERNGRTSGRVVEVAARTRQLVVGTYVERGDEAVVRPREAELGVIRVPKTQLARSGDIVKVRLGVGDKLFSRHDQLTGEVAGSLGAEDDHSIEVLSVAYSKGFQDEFPPEVMDEADAFPLALTEEDVHSEGRRDLRKMGLVTIDGEDARDFDDAIFVEDTADGWRLVVAIADVAHYVREEMALDAEALRRATSVYLPGRVLPMLPERLSNGLCSLKPDEDRLCMVADMQISRAGVTTATEIFPAVMRSVARCTYTEVHQVLNGESVPHRNAFKPLFERANQLATTLTGMRRGRGAIDFDLPETRVELDEQGVPKRMVKRERWESHRLVEECMLAANEAVARFFRENDIPTVNRYHGEPDEEKLATFIRLLNAYGVPVQQGKGGVTSVELNRVLKSLEGHKEQKALNQLALRSMMQAVYSSYNAGHYGLGAEDYLHFTSPIRRYPDLLVHRLLKAVWSKRLNRDSDAEMDRLEALSQQSSERERAAMQVEREVNQLYACLLMEPHVGEVFPGTVSGLSEAGFYVELDEWFVDGFVKGETVFPKFKFEQTAYQLSFGNGRVVKVGEKVRVQLAAVNLKRKQIDLEIASFVADPDRPTRMAAPQRVGQDRPERHERQGRHERHDRQDRSGSAAKHSARDHESRSVQPPRQEQSSMSAGGKSFDARAVLDRLWKERGGQRSNRSSNDSGNGRSSGNEGRGGGDRGSRGGGGGRGSRGRR